VYLLFAGPWQQTPELGVPESSTRSALDEFNFAWLLGLAPKRSGHDFRRDCVLMFAGFFGQVYKRTQ
jgi:hypothetical protein